MISVINNNNIIFIIAVSVAARSSISFVYIDIVEDEKRERKFFYFCKVGIKLIKVLFVDYRFVVIIKWFLFNGFKNLS